MDLATLELLLAPRGWSLLASLPPYDQERAWRLGADLRDAGYEPALVAAALTQSRLRARAELKFGEFARGMLFTADGLEQATRLEVGARHADRFAAAGVEVVHDLGCGIGADAMAFAALERTVLAVDVDPVTAAIAGVNLRHFPDASARPGRVEETDLPGADPRVGAWLDPARRRRGHADVAGRARRLTRIEELSPSWETVTAIAARVPATGAKLSPGFPRARIPAGTEAQWTSFGGEVLECALWWGVLAARPGRTAAVHTSTGRHVVTEADADPEPPTGGGLPEPGVFLYDPDRALVAAGLVGAVTAAAGGVELAPGVGYVAASAGRDLPWARRYRVIEAMPLRAKAIRAWLRARGVGRLTIKRRGSATDPDALRAQLRLGGRGEHRTVVLTRAGDTEAFLVVEPDTAGPDTAGPGPDAGPGAGREDGPA